MCTADIDHSVMLWHQALQTAAMARDKHAILQGSDFTLVLSGYYKRVK